ncbi:response regulator [Flavobacteriaceae bacterium R38]|nr:response regulator [Flavobacteriaceae bacterium R38]
MITYAIVDDEPIAHEIIEEFANELIQLKKVGNCYNAFEAIRLLQETSVDLLFLDINMPKLSGFEFLKTLSSPPNVIVTSAYKEFAIEGYDLEITDYLLKPFSFERFVKAVNRVSFSESKLKMTSEPQPQYLFIKGDKKHHQVYTNDILLIEAYGNYCKIHLEEETIITLQKISDFETGLPSDFIRVHKSFIIAKNKVKSIEGNTIHLKKQSIPIGQTYKNAIKKFFVD